MKQLTKFEIRELEGQGLGFQNLSSAQLDNNMTQTGQSANISERICRALQNITNFITQIGELFKIGKPQLPIKDILDLLLQKVEETFKGANSTEEVSKLQDKLEEMEKQQNFKAKFEEQLFEELQANDGDECLQKIRDQNQQADKSKKEIVKLQENVKQTAQKLDQKTQLVNNISKALSVAESQCLDKAKAVISQNQKQQTEIQKLQTELGDKTTQLEKCSETVSNLTNQQQQLTATIKQLQSTVEANKQQIENDLKPCKQMLDVKQTQSLPEALKEYKYVQELFGKKGIVPIIQACKQILQADTLQKVTDIVGKESKFGKLISEQMQVTQTELESMKQIQQQQMMETQKLQEDTKIIQSASSIVGCGQNEVVDVLKDFQQFMIKYFKTGDVPLMEQMRQAKPKKLQNFLCVTQTQIIQKQPDIIILTSDIEIQQLSQILDGIDTITRLPWSSLPFQKDKPFKARIPTEFDKVIEVQTQLIDYLSDVIDVGSSQVEKKQLTDLEQFIKKNQIVSADTTQYTLPSSDLVFNLMKEILGNMKRGKAITPDTGTQVRMIFKFCQKVLFGTLHGIVQSVYTKVPYENSAAFQFAIMIFLRSAWGEEKEKILLELVWEQFSKEHNFVFDTQRTGNAAMHPIKADRNWPAMKAFVACAFITCIWGLKPDEDVAVKDGCVEVLPALSGDVNAFDALCWRI